MNQPRIGDIVHYTDTDAVCRAAIVTGRETDSDPLWIDLYIIKPNGTRFELSCAIDLDQPIRVLDENGQTIIQQGQYTPGTWHHIH